MKKRIVALVSALTLVFAMGLNVAAAGSITASDATEISSAAGDVTTFPTSQKDMDASADVAEKILDTSAVTVAPLTDAASAKKLATAVAGMTKKDNVEDVKVLAVFEINGKAGDVTFNVVLKDNEKAYIQHLKDGKVEEIAGSYANGKVTFKFSSFSPVALVVVTEKAAAAVTPAAPASTDQPPYNPAWDPTVTNASAPAAAPVAALVAPKTGDVVMMVSIMAIIFMAGAAVAVAMSKKRA
ncbi:MAG: hypothetical protein K2H45_14315 [Acetatifactor sp.]|nr:hypothetical protein [Acetatifactor sp.]